MPMRNGRGTKTSPCDITPDTSSKPYISFYSTIKFWSLAKARDIFSPVNLLNNYYLYESFGLIDYLYASDKAESSCRNVIASRLRLSGFCLILSLHISSFYRILLKWMRFAFTVQVWLINMDTKRYLVRWAIIGLFVSIAILIPVKGGNKKFMHKCCIRFALHGFTFFTNVAS